MLLNPFVALEERTFGRWPTLTLLVADDVVADVNFETLLVVPEIVAPVESATQPEPL